MPPFPVAPGSVYASAGSNPGSINLSWSPSPTPNVWYWVSYRLSGPPTNAQRPWDEQWTRLPYPLPQTSITINGLAWQEVYEFQVSATNEAGTSGRSSIDWTIVPWARSAIWRPQNSGNNANGMALIFARQGGSDCDATKYQRICFNSRGFWLADQPMTVGDFLIYPWSRDHFETRLRCESIKRSDIRKEWWPVPIHYLEPFFPRLEEHEMIHSKQWAEYRSYSTFVAAYLAAEAWPGPNNFEVGAGLYAGGYEIEPSGSPTTGIRQGCDWLYPN
jgi:hypothetical protein